MKTLQCLIAAGLAFNVSADAIADVVVIVQPSNGDALTTEQVSNLFLGKTTAFPGGNAATPIELPEGNPVRDEFHSKVTKKDAAQLKAYWAKYTFTGKGMPPKDKASEAEVRQFVASTPGAVGYVQKSAVDGSVKVAVSAQ